MKYFDKIFMCNLFIFNNITYNIMKLNLKYYLFH